MIPGADAAISIHGSSTSLEIRNTGSTPADIIIQADKPISGPTATIAPGAAWSAQFSGNVDILLHNRGTTTAYLLLTSPNWNDLRLALFPTGRNDKYDAIMLVQPTNPGWYEETAAEQAPIRP